MATWTSLGHAMRRRMGMPSSHLEAAGKNMERNISTPEEIINSAEHANSARRYVGMSAATSAAPVMPEKGKLMPKKNKQASDPTAGGKANRKNIERAGATYRIVAGFPKGTSPEAAPTMANAKIVPSVAGKQAPNFNAGMTDNY